MKIPFDTSQLCCGVVHLLSERIKKLIEFLTVAAKHCRKAEHSRTFSAACRSEDPPSGGAAGSLKFY
jgi:hypothetical protein